MKATMGMDTSTSTLVFQADLKCCELDKKIARDFNKRDKTWSNSPTAKSITTFGKGLMKEMRERVPMYKARRVGPRAFEVDYIGKSSMTKPDSVLSKDETPPTSDSAEFRDERYA